MTLILAIMALAFGWAAFIMCLGLGARMSAVEKKLQRLCAERSQKQEMEVQSRFMEMESKLDPSYMLMKRLREFDA